VNVEKDTGKKKAGAMNGTSVGMNGNGGGRKEERQAKERDAGERKKVGERKSGGQRNTHEAKKRAEGKSRQGAKCRPDFFCFRRERFDTL